MTPDLSYELEGEREGDVCAKKINGMSKKIKSKIKPTGILFASDSTE